MVVRCSPTEVRPTHHLSLSDGVNQVALILSDASGNARENAFERLPLPRSAIKMFQGEAEYSDQELPWSIKQQTDWSGGRGNDDLDSAANMFYDSRFANTLKAGKLIAGGMETPTIGGYVVGNQHWAHRYADLERMYWRWLTLRSTTRYIAIPFTAPSNYTAGELTVIVRRRGDPGDLNASLRNDNGGEPGTLVAGSAVSVAASQYSNCLAVNWKSSPSSSLTGSTQYWVKVYGDAADDANNYWEILASIAIGTGMQSADDATWAASDYDIFFNLVQTITEFKPHYFIYKGALFCAFEYPTTTAAKLYINGDQGVATAGAASTLTDSTKSWTTNLWKGCILVARWGTGSNYFENYRLIASNTGTAITIEGTWDVNPDNTTEYVILGSGEWTEITGHGLNRVTGVLVFNNLAYFAQGGGHDIRRMRRYNNAGTWTTSWTAETGYRAEFLVAQGSGSTGTIWKAEMADSTVNYATAVIETGGALTFSADTEVGDLGERITGRSLYGDDNNVWFGKEGSIWEMQNVSGTWTPVKMKLDEISAVKDERNARAMIHHNAYLYFSLHNQVQRYYAGALDSIGPGFEVSDKLGAVVQLLGYPGTLIAAVDVPGTTSDRGCIMAYKNGGWHSLFDSDDGRVRGMIIQTLPGDNCDRLWFNAGTSLMWIPIDLSPGDRDPGGYHFYNFRWESALTTGKIFFHLRALQKYLNELSLIGDLDTSNYVEVDYQTDQDEETDWNYLGTIDGTTNELQFDDNTLFKWVRLRFRLCTKTANETPAVEASLLEALIKLTVKWQVVAPFRVRDNDHDLQGVPELLSSDAKLAQLEAWSESPTVLSVSSTSLRLHNKKAFIEAQSLRPVSETHHDGEEIYIWTMSLVEK